MTLHTFSLTIDWPGGRNEVGNLTAHRLETKISIPPEMDGPGIGTNPDEMLLGAAATCYIITLAAMMERGQIDVKPTLKSEGIVEVTNGVFTYREIHHYIELHMAEQDEKKRRMAERYAYKAEEVCMISKALRGNVKIEVHVVMK
ncbi:SACOL1771 family peroxiredoxin [Solibacillus sp. FSL K6-1523]|uniref:SACOL1771 family peroxiredoxin n=1 Tax=Solibacillus sp. FSL K6-1523 TaxID=2921471 RepID=UPI0030F56489